MQADTDVTIRAGVDTLCDSKARERFVPTRYLSHSTMDDGTMILHNSRTGAIGAVAPDQAKEARAALERSARHPAPLTGILHELERGGFLIPEGTDERALVQQSYLEKYDDRSLNLIILPTEQCNFRCLYCYESFERPGMDAGICEGIKRYVTAQQRLQHLDIHWFGGEPLLAPDVVTELTRFFADHCVERGIRYTAAMTTNGSLLTPEIAGEIIPRGVRRFQITLDGIQEEHDQRRVKHGGGDTFNTIMENLRWLHASNLPFTVMVRHNFDPQSLPRLPEFIAMLKAEFGGDPRFTTLFHPIGTWGGPNDRDLVVCEWRSAAQEAMRAKQLAIEAGFRSGAQVEEFTPNGFTCYAANPRSFVIGSDGQLYKCTVELDSHARNIVGQLHADGTMDLDWRKMALWCETNGRDEGKKCTSCFFSPTCHGAVCPKQWMDQNDCDCPPEKLEIRTVLPLLAQEQLLPPPSTWKDTSQSMAR
jgi:uncharacterized protein